MNERNWNKIKSAQPFIKSAEISIDAANAETYHKVRKGGKWDLLVKNLKALYQSFNQLLPSTCLSEVSSSE